MVENDKGVDKKKRTNDDIMQMLKGSSALARAPK
jgi:hypothetical protein